MSDLDLSPLLDSLPPPLRAQLGTSPLREVLTDRLVAARAVWPGLDLADATFLAYVAERLPADATPEQVAHELDLGGLYLACGCALGLTPAIREFERALHPFVEGIARRRGLSAADAEDLAARLREQLLVGDAGHPPRICQYSGRADIRSWLKTAATRMAMRQAQKNARAEELDPDDALVAVVDGGEDIALRTFRQHHREPFKLAFRRAFEAMSADDRLLLRRRFHDGLTGDELAALHGVHRSSIVRRLAAARRALLGHLRAAVVDLLEIAPAEVDSVIKVMKSQFDVSVSYLMRVTVDRAP